MRTAEQREARRQAMVELLRERGTLSVDELGRRFEVTGATVRSDLNALARERKLIRTHGGATVPADAGLAEQPLAKRLQTRSQVKRRMAALAASLVVDGDVVALDASSSSLAVAHELRDKESLTIVTTSLEAAYAVMDRPQHRVMIPGGTVRPEMASIVGEQVVPFLENLRVRWTFFSAYAIDGERGLCDVDTRERDIKRALIAIAAEPVALIDASKWRQPPVAPFWPLDRVPLMISDAVSAEQRSILRAKGVELRLAGS